MAHIGADRFQRIYPLRGKILELILSAVLCLPQHPGKGLWRPGSKAPYFRREAATCFSHTESSEGELHTLCMGSRVPPRPGASKKISFTPPAPVTRTQSAFNGFVWRAQLPNKRGLQLPMPHLALCKGGPDGPAVLTVGRGCAGAGPLVARAPTTRVSARRA